MAAPHERHENDSNHEAETANGKLYTQIYNAAAATYGPTIRTTRYSTNAVAVADSTPDMPGRRLYEFHTSEKSPAGDEVIRRHGVSMTLDRDTNPKQVFIQATSEAGGERLAEVSWRERPQGRFLGRTRELYVGTLALLEREAEYQRAWGHTTYCSAPDAAGMSLMFSHQPGDAQMTASIEEWGEAATITGAAEYATYLVERVQQLQVGTDGEPPVTSQP